MAFLDTDRGAPQGAVPTLPAAGIDLPARLAEWRARYAAWRLYRRTLRELSRLSDADLADLGMNRGGLPGVAWQAVYGK